MFTLNYVSNVVYYFFKLFYYCRTLIFMLCYKDGGLAREKISDTLPKSETKSQWTNFNKAVLQNPPLS